MTAFAAVVVVVMFLGGATVVLSAMADGHDGATEVAGGGGPSGSHARRGWPASAGYPIGLAMILVAVVGTVVSR